MKSIIFLILSILFLSCDGKESRIVLPKARYEQKKLSVNLRPDPLLTKLIIYHTKSYLEELCSQTGIVYDQNIANEISRFMIYQVNWGSYEIPDSEMPKGTVGYRVNVLGYKSSPKPYETSLDKVPTSIRDLERPVMEAVAFTLHYTKLTVTGVGPRKVMLEYDDTSGVYVRYNKETNKVLIDYLEAGDMYCTIKGYFDLAYDQYVDVEDVEVGTYEYE